jgi:signal transduction histidine kinase
MARFRLIFAAVCLVLLVGLGLLVRRVVASVALEREMRHRAVADRVFDELERALSAFLAREEERPFGHYRFTYTPPGQLGGAVAVTRSPLAEPPADDFVVGYFQVDPDGSLHSPLRPREDERARLGLEVQPTAEALTRIAELERTIGSVWRATATAPPDVAVRPSPGSTVALAPAAKASQPAGRSDVGAPVASSYDALEALNKAVEQRAERQAKRSLEYAAPLRDRRARPAPAAPLAAEGLRARATEEKDEAEPAPPATPAAVELPPMVGRAVDAGHLVLYRTVVVDTRGYRQGLLLDVAKLEGWLRAQALGDGSLARYGTLDFPGRSGTASGAEAPFVYLHRFAEPFDDLSARLALRGLPGTSGASLAYLLAALLVASAGLGLAALYRMVSVVVRFAERRSNFAAAVSHELKTPLTAIRMYGEMLRDGMVPSEAKRDEYHRHITAESERLSRLINNVLEFSRLEKGARDLKLAAGSLGPVLTEAATLLEPHVAREGFELALDVDPGLPPVRFERDALLQVLFNLVDNAVKYARDGRPRRITLAAARDGEGARVTVRDHGPGVPPRHLRHVFEPFYRVEQELTRRSTGTGLGLALVRSLVERMGGRVACRNLAEGGFEVGVVLPYAG